MSGREDTWQWLKMEGQDGFRWTCGGMVRERIKIELGSTNFQGASPSNCKVKVE